MSTEKHLHSQIGDAVYQSKKRLFFRLGTGQDLEFAVDQFMLELRIALDKITTTKNASSPSDGALGVNGAVRTGADESSISQAKT